MGIEPVGDLARTARLVGDALGLVFHEDEVGSFDEFPAFIGEKDGVEYALLGNPPADEDVRDEPTRDFELQVRTLHFVAGEQKVDISSQLTAEILRSRNVRAWLLN